MRTINDLLKNNENVWFYLGENQLLKETFASELNGLGFTFLNGKSITTDQIGRIMAVHSDGKIAYVSLMVWSVSFHPGDGSYGARHSFYHIPKINYAKYISGDEDYLMTKCNFTRIR